MQKKKINYKLYGVDPSASAFRSNYDKKIRVIENFFNNKTVEKIFVRTKRKFSLITSYAMFYDVENPNEFCSNISKILDEEGIWSLEFSYFPLLLKNLTYDQICHEHCVYYTLSTFDQIIKKNGLKLIDFNLNEINGGSIEIICGKKESFFKPKFNKIKKLINSEKKLNTRDYIKFQKQVASSKNSLKSFLKKLKNTEVIGYGASTKGNIIINYCRLKKKKY